MKDVNDNIELPFIIKISFNKLLSYYETLAKSDDEFLAAKAKRVLQIQENIPMLRDGFTKIAYLDKYKKEIDIILQDSFSEILTKNEIKTASVPFHDIVFNSSERFRNILKAAGDEYKLEIRDMPDDSRYIVACIIILDYCYNFKTNHSRPLYYQIPDANGILKSYKILYNADFVEIIPNKNTKTITKADYNELIDNFDNIDLWKEKFPQGSYDFKGFVISNIFDITADQSISNIKSSLIAKEKRQDERFMDNFESIFQSFLGMNDLEVGFSMYNKREDVLMPVYDAGIDSFLVQANKNCEKDSKDCAKIFCEHSYNTLFKDKTFYSISDIEGYNAWSEGKAPQIALLAKKGYKSTILAPIADGDNLLGILELVSKKKHVLNSVVSNKLIDVMPYIVAAIKRSRQEEEHLIEAIIQRECTAIHSSVKWKFEDAARQFLIDQQHEGEEATFKKIIFKNVYPLFGQIDVKGSSNARNQATQKDLALQLMLIGKIIDKSFEFEKLPVLEKLKFEIDTLSEEISNDFKVDSEQRITAFFRKEIEPLFQFQLKNKSYLEEDIKDYYSKIDSSLGLIYYYRKNYDDTITLINKNMSAVIDKEQIEAQRMYPHFFERFKTDGVEHNMYIGESITKEDSFNSVYLYNLRLWQLQVMCNMENEFYINRDKYPLALDVASMILVFNQSLSIRFRMDEKHFDVDGTYNARYEVVKKRVDKANIKGTEERATTHGKITIVYSQKEDEIEYLQYVNFLQSKKVLGDSVEILELEDLQGVTGLKAIRVNLLYKNTKKHKKEFYNYDDLMKELKV